MEQIRLSLTDEIKKQVETQIRYGLDRQMEQVSDGNYRSELDSIIRSEVLKQVEEQVNDQIDEHIPVRLQQQAEESKEQLRDIETSLNNSYVVIMITGAMLDIKN